MLINISYKLNKYKYIINMFENFKVVWGAVKPQNSGQLRFFKKLSVIERCPLLGDNLKKILTS